MKLLSIRSRLWAGSVVVIAAAVGAALLVDLPSQTQADSPKKAAAPAVPVSVAVVEPKATVAWDEFSGRLEAIERVPAPCSRCISAKARWSSRATCW